MPKFKTARNELTAYAFACGYMQSRTLPDGAYITLWQEHGTYHVRAHNKARGRIFWDSFSSLKEAKNRYRQALSI